MNHEQEIDDWRFIESDTPFSLKKVKTNNEEQINV